VLYHTGPSGNQSPRYHVAGQTFAEAERLGRKLGAAVVAAIAALRPEDFSGDLAVGGRLGAVALPARRFKPVAAAEASLKAAVTEFERLQREKAPHGPVRTAECVVFGAEEALTLARAQADGRLDALRKQYAAAEVQVLQIGGTFFVGLPCEIFVEYGLEIKKRAPGRAFVISLANGDLQGYIVTPEADAAGGYEAQCSFFRPEAGAVMVNEAIRLMTELGASR